MSALELLRPYLQHLDTCRKWSPGWWDIALVVALYCLGCIGGWLFGYCEATMRWTGMWPYQHRRAGRKLFGCPPDGEDVVRKAEEEL